MAKIEGSPHFLLLYWNKLRNWNITIVLGGNFILVGCVLRPIWIILILTRLLILLLLTFLIFTRLIWWGFMARILLLIILVFWITCSWWPTALVIVFVGWACAWIWRVIRALLLSLWGVLASSTSGFWRHSRIFAPFLEFCWILILWLLLLEFIVLSGSRFDDWWRNRLL